MVQVENSAWTQVNHQRLLQRKIEQYGVSILLRAAMLTRQLPAFSRRQALDMKDVDLNDVSVDLLKTLRCMIREHIVLNVVASRDLGTVRADPGQIGQIQINPLLNIRDATPVVGTPCIETATA